MDDLLKQLAAVSTAVAAAEEELDGGAPGAAEPHLEEAGRGLQELRGRWPGLDARERKVLGAAAAPVRARLDAARARLPKRRALSEGEAVHDPEQDAEPVEAGEAGVAGAARG